MQDYGGLDVMVTPYPGVIRVGVAKTSTKALCPVYFLIAVLLNNTW